MSEITKLPDGSAFFTETVMSKEEAMALPLMDRPLCYRISSEIYHAVFEAIGAASVCWKPRPGKEVFSIDEASKVAVDLCFKIANELEKQADAFAAGKAEGRIEGLREAANGLTKGQAWARADRLEREAKAKGKGE